MKQFLAEFKNSLYNVSWLSAQRAVGGRAWAYFFVLTFFASLLLSIPLVHYIPSLVKEFKTFVATEVPDFTATLKDRQLTVDGLPQPFEKTWSSKSDGVFVLHVDTVSTSTMEEQVAAVPKEKDAMYFFIGRTAFATVDGHDNTVRLQPITTDDTTSITRADLAAKLDSVVTVMLYPLILFLLILVYIFIVIGKLLQLVMLSFFIFIIAKISKRTVTFTEVFTMGLFAVTLPTVVLSIMNGLGGAPALLYSTILCAMLLGAVWSKPAAPSKEIPPPAAS